MSSESQSKYQVGVQVHPESSRLDGENTYEIVNSFTYDSDTYWVLRHSSGLTINRTTEKLDSMWVIIDPTPLIRTGDILAARDGTLFLVAEPTVVYRLTGPREGRTWEFPVKWAEKYGPLEKLTNNAGSGFHEILQDRPLA